MEEIKEISFSTLKMEFDDDDYVLVWKVITDKAGYWLRKERAGYFSDKKNVEWNMNDNFSGKKASEELRKKVIFDVYLQSELPHKFTYLSRETLINNLLVLSQTLVSYDKETKKRKNK